VTPLKNQKKKENFHGFLHDKPLVILNLFFFIGQFD
jgi:hypothetical protein